MQLFQLQRLSPPEGNITFLGGTTWCVARAGARQFDLQNALDWACGLGMADCRPIQTGGPCFEPNTLLSHASFAFNTYYQQNGNSDIACNFGGTAMLTKINPSHEKCIYVTSSPRIENMKSEAPPFAQRKVKHYVVENSYDSSSIVLRKLRCNFAICKIKFKRRPLFCLGESRGGHNQEEIL
uniref:Beta-1,3-glucanase 9 n=1 Tax=Solanum tuberosum TaxID=4113 RepID=K9MBJ6_SOLTU|nr:beta-1,3-glucanase 9 [Solanum tuberosum]